MLARLLEVPCVDDVAVDRSGTYLRIEVAPGVIDCVGAVSSWLEGEGVFVDVPSEPVSAPRWFRPSEVRELSRVEAEEIGAQVVAAIVPAPDAANDRRLRELIASHLHQAFVTHHLERGERVPLRPTIDRIRAETAAIIGTEQVDALVDALSSRFDVTAS